MKLRNKKTGEIENWCIDKDIFRTCDSRIQVNSLAELNEEWEDCEEDELLYVISAEHKSGYQCVLKEEYPEICEVAKELGIGFETEKECLEAVEKLKAWKRLKDKGFRFNNWEFRDILDGNLVIEAHLNFDNTGNIQRDLELIFGGEE